MSGGMWWEVEKEFVVINKGDEPSVEFGCVIWVRKFASGGEVAKGDGKAFVVAVPGYATVA